MPIIVIKCTLYVGGIGMLITDFVETDAPSPTLNGDLFPTDRKSRKRFAPSIIYMEPALKKLFTLAFKA